MPKAINCIRSEPFSILHIISEGMLQGGRGGGGGKMGERLPSNLAQVHPTVGVRHGLVEKTAYTLYMLVLFCVFFFLFFFFVFVFVYQYYLFIYLFLFINLLF